MKINEKGKTKMSTISVKEDLTMKLKVIGYWATTAVVAFELLAGGVTDLIHGPALLFAGDPVVPVLAQLGYPVYLLAILGVWKLLGAIVLLIPRFPRLKEWAYAGTFFVYVGATASWAARGGGMGDLIVPIILAGLTLASWLLRPPRRILGVLFHARAHV
jgi:uncharacterized membrane protein YphA (DoxX/SURF4 family)